MREQTTLIKNGTLLTMNARGAILSGDLLIRGDRIASVGEDVGGADVVIDAGGCAELPGFVQTHVHL